MLVESHESEVSASPARRILWNITGHDRPVLSEACVQVESGHSGT